MLESVLFLFGFFSGNRKRLNYVKKVVARRELCFKKKISVTVDRPRGPLRRKPLPRQEFNRICFHVLLYEMKKIRFNLIYKRTRNVDVFLWGNLMPTSGYNKIPSFSRPVGHKEAEKRERDAQESSVAVAGRIWKTGGADKGEKAGFMLFLVDLQQR